MTDRGNHLHVDQADEAAVHFARSADAIAEAQASKVVKLAARVNKVYDDARVALAKQDVATAREKVAEYRRVIQRQRLPGANHGFMELRTRIALAEGDYDTALEQIERADPRDPRILYLAAQIYHVSGRTAEARASCIEVTNFNEPRFELAYVRPKARRLLAEL